jgi:serine/threonine protein kinase
MIGTKLAHYEIRAHLGSGGMGDVYQASDTKLNREVAIKVLPEVFAHDAGRMARFEREAKVLASLNHPNIAHIYGVEERALVMELAEGESPKGPMPFDEAWKIAVQIADALEYAHEQGVVHRDLKPANIKVTPDGVVKLLDFGLAKAFGDTPDTAGNDPWNSPTLTLGGTVAGIIIGTAAYMAPEQAKGKRVDKRADVWSWGVVLYELLTGKRLFQGEDTADTLAQVLTKEPPLGQVPQKVQRLLGECLQKDPKLRLRDIGDAKRLLEASTPASAAARSRFSWAMVATMTAISLVLAYVSWKHFREDAPRVVKFSLVPPKKGTFPTNLPTMSVSPDGQRIAFEVLEDGNARSLWVRELNDLTPRMLTPVTRAEMPIWAPDSRRLAFFDGGQLKKIDVNGGPAVTLGSTVDGQDANGSWNKDDVIIFGKFFGNEPLFRISANGGSPEPITELDKARGEVAHWAPSFLPDGHHFLYVALTADSEKSAVYIGDLASKTRKQVLAFGTRAIYVNPGYLLFVRDRTLMAQPFDTGNLELRGDAFPVGDQIDQAQTFASTAHFSASQNGVLAYTSGGATGDAQLTWLDRNGKKLGTVGAPGYLGSFSLSHDDSRVVYPRGDQSAGRFDLWLNDLVHNSETRLTSSGNNNWPVFSADGTQVFFESNRDGDYKIYRKAANGTGTDEVIDATHKWPTDASPQYLFTNSSPDEKSGGHMWVRPLSGDRKPIPYAPTEFNETLPRISPDGSWLAYQSDISKRPEVYVLSFPQLGGKWTVSTSGGRAPVWSRDGRELYYYSRDNKIMAVEVTPGKQFQFGIPKALFPVRFSVGSARFEVSRDGRFLVPAAVEQDASAPMTVVLNWPEMLKKK